MARTKKSGEASTSTAVKLKQSDSIVSDKYAETPQPQDIQPTKTVSQEQNKFASFQEFKTFVKTNFIEGSGIAPELFAECIEFHTDLEASAGNDAEYPIHELLNWKQPTIYGHQARETIYAAMFKNEDGSIWQGIISRWDEKSKKPYQYLAPTQNGDRVFLPPVPNSIRRKIGSRYGVEVPEEGSFWEWLKEATQVEISRAGGDGNFTAYTGSLVPLKVPRIVTEGGKKGLALLTQGYIPLSLYGCTCGGREGLIPDLRQFNQEGSIWLLAFDRDSKEETRRKVNAAKRKLEKVLAKDGFKNYIEDIVWSSEDGKGVDDLIVNKGFGAFDTAYSRALSRLEKQFSGAASGTADEPEKHKNAPPDQMAKKIAEDYRGKLAFNDETKQWMRYGDDLNRSLDDLPFGIWSPESNEYMEAIVYKILVGKEVEAFAFGADYVSSVLKLLRHELIERRWNEVSPREYLPFTNGVVEIATRKLLPHTPGYKLTWSLPREYSTDGGSWDNISNFLEHLSNGNADIKELLICYCNAVIKGRYDLQKFIHLIGLGGTGKGTFTRLVTELIGDQNVLVTNLPAWCMNQFEGANAFGKRLVIFPDEDPYRGSIGRFLSLTGEDKVRAEEKGKRAFNFDYQGMTLVVSNFPVFSGGSSSRAKRRTITVPCNKIVSEGQRKQLSKIFEPELAAFTNYLLSLADDHVTAVLKGEKEIPQCTLEFWENQMKGDSVAAWVNERVVYDPMALTPIGNDRNEGVNGADVYTLFGSYIRHCLASGDSPKSCKVFSPDLIELCHTILNWPVEKQRTKTGVFIKGLRLRVPVKDNEIPHYDYWLMSRVLDDVGSGVGLGVGLKALPCKEDVGYVGFAGGSLGEGVNKTELVINSVQNQQAADGEESDRASQTLGTDRGYKPGDRVFSTHPLQGGELVVQDYPYEGDFNFIRTVDHSLVYVGYLKKVVEVCEATQNFGPGDKVRIINQNCDCFGQEDEITAIYSMAKEAKLKVNGRLPFDFLDLVQRAPAPALENSLNITEEKPLPTPMEFSFPGIFGETKILVEFTGRPKKGGVTFNISFTFPSGKGATLKNTFIPTLGKEKSIEAIKAIALEKIEAWQSKAMLKKGRLYSVRQVGDEDCLDYIWALDCALVSVPNPPFSNQYIFSHDGKTIVASDLSEFRWQAPGES
ncbi:phage/plasmid primase, P4 family, C-terminal domain protein [Cylindrospermum stagnale PCC 7417]|uniref:Phage/plasmid primase, P4 family, C-terminal domain protein n=1 Tax=Cylindrospermum stagnale PCC 7417 TaxID=56107 RepID=K9WX32_9NOST|nr:phage/plasmid primase, P4 family [Cylindrospermum stagnale]AFZ24768.1 phage/plasmid primase, P4 family, C-terminal domain protein [Cylindrospermum stagnale PCC 7417]